MHYCDCKGTTKLQLLQRVFQRMLTLQLPELLSGSEYLGSEPDPKGRDYIIASHLFRTQIADDTSWIIVNETIWDDCWVHSVSDNIPDINEEQDL